MEDLDTLLNSVAVALVLLDGGARIIFANKAFGALTEVDPEALAGRHIDELLPALPHGPEGFSFVRRGRGGEEPVRVHSSTIQFGGSDCSLLTVVRQQGNDPALPSGGFLATLPAAVRKTLLDQAHSVRYTAASQILEPGRPSRPGVVVDGLVRYYVSGSDGREATITYAQAGEAIGLAHFFVPDLAMNAQAVTETTLLHFAPARFDQLTATEPAMARAVAHHFATRLKPIPATFNAFAFGSVRQRLAAHLLKLATQRDADGRPVALVTHQSLANAIGSVREVVARGLRDLRILGLISTTHSSVVVSDEIGLSRVAEGHWKEGIRRRRRREADRTLPQG